MGSPGPGQTTDVPHEGLVLRPAGVLQVPAPVAEVVEAGEIPAEVGSLLHATEGAQSVLEVGIHLHFLAKPWSLDLDEGSRHGLHVGAAVVESDSARPDRILVLVRV